MGGHLKRIGLEKHGDCKFCSDEEKAPECLLCECSAVSNMKTKLFAGKETMMRLASAQMLLTGGTIALKATECIVTPTATINNRVVDLNRQTVSRY